jgi:hypothetical protein
VVKRKIPSTCRNSNTDYPHEIDLEKFRRFKYVDFVKTEHFYFVLIICLLIYQFRVRELKLSHFALTVSRLSYFFPQICKQF